MKILEINHLCKVYPSFQLKDVSFSLEKGKICGFIGRNGAGKTTTLKSILNVIHPDGGEVMLFGKRFIEHELETKQRIGYISGGINYYSQKKLKKITAVTKSFYPKWDEGAYQRYMKKFNLNEDKTPKELSEGMKVKYALVLALSHHAELLILDEPTSGLDPISRDELLEIFMGLCDEGITILFSTHITSDLDKCADHIVYIQQGEVIADKDFNSFVADYQIIEVRKEALTEELKKRALGIKRSKNGHSVLLKAGELIPDEAVSHPVDIEAIMIHLEKEGE